MGEVEDKPSALGMAWYEDLYIIFEANNDILQY